MHVSGRALRGLQTKPGSVLSLLNRQPACLRNDALILSSSVSQRPQAINRGALALKTILLGIPLLLSGGCKNYFVDKLAFFPEKANDYPALIVANTEELWLTTRDDVRIHSFYLKNTESDRVVLFFHGNAGNAYSRLTDASLLRDMGLNVLLLDYRGYGKSNGTPTEKGLYLDADAAYQAVLKNKGFAQNKIYLYGRSIGSTVAVDLSSRYTVAATVLVAPLASGRAMAKKMGFTWFDWLVEGVFDNLGKAKDINSPVLIIHGGQDRVVPLAQGRDLYNAIHHPGKQMAIADNAGHNDISDSTDIDFWQLIDDFYNN
ncbi:MAG: alpha/beta hydrolase [Gammaproteobacteria bacterium]|nr:alpha/beta hydrolase [Gammaproteobacteria bacterium]